MAAFTIPGVAKEKVDQLVREWQLFKRGKFKGQQVVSFLGPFYAKGLSFALRPPQQCSYPFSWIRVTRFAGAQVVTPRDFARPFREIVASELCDELPAPVSFVHTADVGALAALHLVQDKVQQSFGRVLSHRLSKVFGRQLWQDASPQLVVDILRRNLLKTIEYVVGSCLLENSAFILPDMWKSLVPLLALWRSGNLPLGFDRRNIHELNVLTPEGEPRDQFRAIVLCAEPV